MEASSGQLRSSDDAREPSRAAAGDPVSVAFFASTLTAGGAERQLQHLVMNLDRRCFTPRVYTLRRPGLIGEELVRRGVPVEPDLAPSRFPWPWTPVAIARRWRRAGVRLLYCLDHTNAILVGVMAARLGGGMPVLAAVHTTGQWDKASVPWPVRLALNGVSRLVSIAESQRDYLIESEGIPPAKITVIRNGIPALDPAALPSKEEARAALRISPDEGPVVGMVAMLRPEKAHENLLVAARRILERHPQALFVLVGDGPRRRELEGMAEELEIAQQVRFLGLREDVPQLLPAFDVSVLSSHARVETLPLSQMEAMSLGIPVVATRVGALHELVNDGVEGRLVPPGDPGALAEALEWILADPARARSLGSAARERVLRDFTVERMALETETLLKELLAS